MAQVIRRLLRRSRSEEGANLIEFALVLPMLLLVVLGIAEFGFIFQSYEVVTNSAREGARMAVLPGYNSVAGDEAVRGRVQAYITAGRVPGTALVTVSPPFALAVITPPVNVRRVTVNYTHTIMFLSAIDDFFETTYSNVALTSVSEMRVEPGN